MGFGVIHLLCTHHLYTPGSVRGGVKTQYAYRISVMLSAYRGGNGESEFVSSCVHNKWMNSLAWLQGFRILFGSESEFSEVF